MKKNRTVVLLGAGAALPWGGKLTTELTKTIVQECTFKTKSNKNFLEFLQEHYFDALKRNNSIKKADIHFEILISIVEYLAQYYQNINQTPVIAIRPEWIELFGITKTIADELPIIKGGKTSYLGNHGEVTFENNENLKLRTSNGFEYSRFFCCLHDEIINTIKKHVSAYSKEKLPNDKMTNFLNKLVKEDIVRIYSTNYDNIINDLNLASPIFNGFDDEYLKVYYDKIDVKEKARGLNLYKVLNDIDINCFYSLHGNINFSPIKNYNTLKSISPLVFFPKRGINFDQRYGGDTAPIEKNELINYEIISGQRKIINTAIEPYKSFFNVFQRDCLMANTILCIGFSFTDGHIQKQIFNSICHPRNDLKNNLKVILITHLPGIKDASELGFAKNDPIKLLLKNDEFNEFYFLCFSESKTKKHWYESDNSANQPPPFCEVKFKVYTNGFENFLQDELNWEMLVN